MSDITDEQWDSLIESIIQKKCILFLGPGITINFNNRNSLESFYREISQKSADNVAFHKTDNLLVFKDYDLEGDYRHKVVEFFKKDFSNELLEKLIDIPFYLIISATPDHTIANIFEKKKYNYQKNFLSKTNKKNNEFVIQEVPLIYNLFGDIEDEMSIIFSHVDLFEYLERGWIDSKSLPEDISTRFNKENTSNIIFLGFEFDKWYYQFILYLCKLNYAGCRRYAAFHETFGSEMMALCESNYHITFVNKEMKDFVDKLYHDFPKGKFRKPSLEAEKPKKWKKEKFVSFLSDALSQNDWETFCFTHFEEVYNDFTNNQTKQYQIIILMNFVSHHEKFKELYDLCEEFNEESFKKYIPYYE